MVTAFNNGDSSALVLTSLPAIYRLTASPQLATHRLWLTLTESESESYITTDGQSASLSWNKAPVWGLRPYFCHCQTVAGLLMWSAFSLTRGRVCRLQLLLVLASAVIFWVRVQWDSWPYFTVSDSILPFSSPPTTRRVTVEVFDPASTR
jgi:hypothetical protein